MNANELADVLEIAQGNNNSVELIPEAIAMLRKLDGQLAFRIDAVTKYQAWIKELEVSKQSWEIIAKGYSKTIDEQQAEIERLTTKNLEWLANWNEQQTKIEALKQKVAHEYMNYLLETETLKLQCAKYEELIASWNEK